MNLESLIELDHVLVTSAKPVSLFQKLGELNHVLLIDMPLLNLLKFQVYEVDLLQEFLYELLLLLILV